jgi:hypothetical protein
LESGIPFVLIFPGKYCGLHLSTAINIIWQAGSKIGTINNGNYIDTFVEYIITLIMLWAVTIFPGGCSEFKDYCCEGINAIKNMISTISPEKEEALPIFTVELKLNLRRL